jgi:predicted nucleotidyltransferase
MELVNNNIILKRIPSELDKFAVEFLKILEKYSDYVVISGYVSILLGRTRSTEDIDVFIRPITKDVFSKMYEELKENNYWCLNAESLDEIFSYLTDSLAVRFAKKETYAPNFEVKFPKDELDNEVFDDFITVEISIGKIKISSLERHIAFKNYYLGSRKDEEDALHVEELFKDNIDFDKVNKYRYLIDERKKRQGYGK